MFPKFFEEIVNDISRLEVCHLLLFYSDYFGRDFEWDI